MRWPARATRQGYESTFVNGTQIVSRDEFTGELPGQAAARPPLSKAPNPN